MKTLKILVFSIFILFTSAYAANLYAEWKISQNDYVLAFDTSKAKGTIGGLKGKVSFDPKNLAQSNIQVQVDVNTLDLGMGMKTKHAKADDFFDVEKYPSITFNSTSFAKTASGYVVDGNLKIKDVTKPVKIPFTFSEKGNTGEFLGSFEINREDFNLIKKGVGEIVKIDIKLPVTK